MQMWLLMLVQPLAGVPDVALFFHVPRLGGIPHVSVRPGGFRRSRRLEGKLGWACPMALVGAVICLKGDWLEYCTTFGFPLWSDTRCPCFACHASKAEMFHDAALSAVSLPWPEASHADYELACQNCEFVVVVSASDIAHISANLWYDKRAKRGNRGRTLTVDIPALGLLVGDRLEPSLELTDVSAFEMVTPGTSITFWRTANETRSRHRNPVFDRVLGIRAA